MRLARGGVSLTVTLAVSISLLVLVAVVVVLGLGLVSGARNTMALLRDKSELFVSSVVQRVRSHLEPAERQLEFIENLVAERALDPTDQDRMVTMMTGSLAAAPQISAILFMNKERQTFIIGRVPGKPPSKVRFFRRNDSRDEVMNQAYDQTKVQKGVIWGDPVWRELPQETMLNLLIGLQRDGQFLGVLIAAVSVRRLSNYLSHLAPVSGASAFVLYNKNRVLAHANLTGTKFPRTKEEPLPALSKIGDPILAAIWQKENRYPLDVLRGGEDLKGHVLEILSDEFIFLYREASGFGDKPWQIGSYFRSADVNSELERLKRAMFAGLIWLVLSVFVAVLLARRIAKPIVELAGAASKIGQLEISKTSELPGSVFRELNQQAVAFNSMLHGLKWFEAYVPKKLVRRLIQQDDGNAAKSEERVVTVMFTDIAGFTTLSEAMPAAELASLLNDHFAMLASCIESEDGTVDKFIGDSVMAFWGAPDEQPDHAERAVRAANAIRTAVDQDNARRTAQGLAPLAVRIGLHSGSVTVGNIGAPERINYTIIGDTVNVGQRLEQFAKSVDNAAARPSSVTVVSSGAIVGQLKKNDDWFSLGMHNLRGRDGKIEVFYLG